MSIDNSVRFNRCQGIYNLVLEPQSWCFVVERAAFILSDHVMQIMNCGKCNSKTRVLKYKNDVLWRSYAGATLSFPFKVLLYPFAGDAFSNIEDTYNIFERFIKLDLRYCGEMYGGNKCVYSPPIFLIYDISKRHLLHTTCRQQ